MLRVSLGTALHQPEPGRCGDRQTNRPVAPDRRAPVEQCGDSAPYLHDGSARTLEEIWTVFNPHDRHGVTNDLSKDELNDLIEYVKTL